MLVKTNAFILSSLKYGDKSLIIKCYTQFGGLKSFIIKNAFSGKKKNNSLLFPLSEWEIVYEEKNKQTLLFFKEYRLRNYYKTLHTDSYKSAIVLFLTEMLNQVLKEESKEEELYEFIHSSLNLFDEKETNFSDFHLWFLLNFTRFLGFYPNTENFNSNFFESESGTFVDESSSAYALKGDELNLFRELINFEFNASSKNQFSQKKREILLNIIIQYYSLHLTEFKEPHSLVVLHQLFS